MVPHNYVQITNKIKATVNYLGIYDEMFYWCSNLEYRILSRTIQNITGELQR